MNANGRVETPELLDGVVVPFEWVGSFAEGLSDADLPDSPEDVGRWLGSVLGGAAQGAATGLAAGPWGALVGGLVGAGLGAVQAASGPGAPAPPRRPARPSLPPRVPPPATRRRPPTTPQPAGGTPEISALIAQLAALVPALTQLAGGRPANPPAPASVGDTAEAGDDAENLTAAVATETLWEEYAGYLGAAEPSMPGDSAGEDAEDDEDFEGC
ncbi:MAG TPA: hypothetical protein VGX25_02055 [Actinophytocola sp.]|uniref:hypothetical protein n=1 Tax=Actinophytocola sp. TaxID=1872138 RepID=UPI002DDCDEBB|nr:hypothetical protein [Actinophytocola sp.]HEV2778162.1 hypothetical protein [Actinophytocola sp.]